MPIYATCDKCGETLDVVREEMLEGSNMRCCIPCAKEQDIVKCECGTLTDTHREGWCMDCWESTYFSREGVCTSCGEWETLHDDRDLCFDCYTKGEEK